MQMKQKITLGHLEEMAFKAEVNGHEITIDADEQFGGKNRGPRPKPLLLVSLAGCTAMDVVSLLKKMRVDFDDFKIDIEADMTEEHPKYYDKIKIIYHLFGKDINKAKVEKAVNLSQERYCGVSAMLSKSSELTFEIIYH
jgi:putative redox protein